MIDDARGIVGAVGGFLASSGIRPGRIEHSGKLRARQTAEILADLGGAPDALVHTAGINTPDRFMAHGDPAKIASHESWKRVLDINVLGVVNMVQAVAAPMAEDGKEVLASMGDDTPLPVLSHKLRSLYDSFRQSFAQVTNPPIDPLRESAVMSLETCIGREHNVFNETASHAFRVLLPWPVLNYVKYQTLLKLDQRYYRKVRFSLNFGIGKKPRLKHAAIHCASFPVRGLQFRVVSNRQVNCFF